MSETLKTFHPMLMVPHVISFSVVVYTNGPAPSWPTDAIRNALVAALPPGTGVGLLTNTMHGIYSGEQS